jgi:hypothetical protein
MDPSQTLLHLGCIYEGTVWFPQQKMMLCTAVPLYADFSTTSLHAFKLPMTQDSMFNPFSASLQRC